jgi:hypothetical protein
MFDEKFLCASTIDDASLHTRIEADARAGYAGIGPRPGHVARALKTGSSISDIRMELRDLHHSTGRDLQDLTDVTDRTRAATETLYQELVDNGARPRVLSTTAGDLDLKIPKLRAGTFFPALLGRRRRVDQALFAVVMEPYAQSPRPKGRRFGEGTRR